MQAEDSAAVPLQIPYRGMSTRYPLAQMPPEFAPWIENMEVGPGMLESPLGINWEFNAVTNYVGAIAQHPTDRNQVVHLDTYDSVLRLQPYNPFDGTSGSQVTKGATGGQVAQATTLGYNDTVYFFLQGDQPAVYNGTTLANVGFTGPTLADLVGGFAYNEHLFVFEHQSSSVWYPSAPGTVAGAFNEYDLKNVTDDNGVVMCGFAFTLSSGLNSQVLWCLVFDTGEVLTYSGTRPNASDWVQRGHARIAAPLGYQTWVDVNGDVLVFTKQGIVSMRELFTNAQGNIQAASITDEIEKYWVQLCEDIQVGDAPTSYDVRSATLAKINGAYHQIKNKLAVFVPKTLKPRTAGSSRFGYELSDGCMVLIYDFTNRAWTARTFTAIPSGISSSLISSYYHPRSNKLFFGTDDLSDEACWSLWGNTEWVDLYNQAGDESNITPTVISAPIPLPGEKQLKGFQLLQSGHSSATSSTKMRARGNIGEKTTGYCQFGTLGSGVSRNLYNVGLTSEFIQWELQSITGTNADQPFQVLNVTALLEQGGVLG
jgi:hypothetical protein